MSETVQVWETDYLLVNDYEKPTYRQVGESKLSIEPSDTQLPKFVHQNSTTARPRVRVSVLAEGSRDHRDGSEACKAALAENLNCRISRHSSFIRSTHCEVAQND